MLTVVRPSPLRLWGFLLTVIGGALVAFGSIGDWAAVSLGGDVDNAVPTKGIDLWQGMVTVALGALIVIAILALRFVRPGRRAALAVAIVGLGAVALAVSVWCLLALDSVVADTGVDALVEAVVAQLGMAEPRARELVAQALGSAGIEVRAQPGLWLVATGAGLATIGGMVDVAWVRHKRRAGDAIDPDTLAGGPDA